MSNKPKRRAARDNPRKSPLAPEALAAKARAGLDSGDFRDAIADYKSLLKLEPRDEWRSALAEAYAGRARDLAAKGMLKEALVMWENRAALDPSVPFDSDYAALLLRLDRPDPILDQLARPDDLPPALLGRLRALIAARVLSGDLALVDRVPAEDPLRLHAEPARDALAAYGAGDDARARAALERIPFRSPYRDWSLILRALMSLPTDPADAARQLARITDDSAFVAIKQAAELALLPESAFLERVRAPGKNRLRLACALRGWPPERIALWEELQRLGNPPKPELLMRFLHGHRKPLGEDWARRAQLRIHFQHLPASQTWLRSAGAAPLDALEAALVKAWRAERTLEDPWEIVESWSDVALNMKLTPPGRADGLEHQRLIALALRRGDRVVDLLSAEHTPDKEMSELHEFACQEVEHSLDFDPEDCDTYVRLIRFYRHLGQTKDVRRLLDAASERWPEERRILLATLDAALDSGAFKKAAGIARRILATDPINSGVRDRLVDAHLAHARKQVGKSRPDLARKELSAASEWVRGDQPREKIDLLSGFVTLLENREAGTRALADIAERLGGGLAARFALVFAGESLGLSPARSLEALSAQRMAKPSQEDVLAAISRLRQRLDASAGIPGGVETFLTKALADAPWAKFARGELESICETLRRARLHKVRQTVARLALKRWRKAPIFELHAFESKYPKGCSDPMNRDVLNLELAMDNARADGDTRTALRIQEALEASRPFGFGSDPFGALFDFDDDEDDEDDEDPFDGLPAGMDGSPEALISLFKALGLDKAMDLLGIPAPLKRELKQAARQRGEANIIAEFARFFEQGGGTGELDLFPAPPRSRRRRR